MESWRQALASVGINVAPGDATHVVLVGPEPGTRTPFLIETLKPGQSPAKITPPSEPRALLVGKKMTPAVAQAATAAGWCIATAQGDVRLRIGGQLIEREPDAAEESTARTKRGRPSWSAFTVARVLAAWDAAHPSSPQARKTHGTGRRQRDIARAAGVSQPTVARAIQKLSELEFRHWRTQDHMQEHGAGGAADHVRTDATHESRDLGTWWEAQYPGPGGTVTYWFDLESPLQQARKLAAQVDEENTFKPAHQQRRLAFSGDVACDLIAPWQRPKKVVAYLDGPVDVARAGFIPADSAQDATMTLIAPADPGVWLPTKWLLPGLGRTAELADPLQVMHDVVAERTSTSTESAERLWGVLRDSVAPRWVDCRFGDHDHD